MHKWLRMCSRIKFISLINVFGLFLCFKMISKKALINISLILQYFVLKMLLRNLIKTLVIRMMLWLRKVIFLCLILFHLMMFCILKAKNILRTILFLSCTKKVWQIFRGVRDFEGESCFVAKEVCESCKSSGWACWVELWAGSWRVLSFCYLRFNA